MHCCFEVVSCSAVVQALQAGDERLLEQVFSVSGKAADSLITEAVEQVPRQLVATLIRALADRLVSHPKKAFQLMQWLQACLHVHAATCMNYPHMRQLVEGLNRYVQDRCEQFG